MKKKINAIVGFIVTIVVCLFLGSCASDNVEPTYKNSGTIIYHLEGASYKNSTEDVKVYYPVKKDGQTTVNKSLDDLTEQYKINSPGSDLVLVGWYKNKSESGEYSNQFVFGNDKIGYNETIELYAKWSKKFVHTINYYANIDGQDILLASRGDISAGAKFTLKEDDESMIRTSLYDKGLTFINSFNYDNKDYTMSEFQNLTMPAENEITEDITANVYVNYIVGKYYLVSNSSDFKNALGEVKKYDGLYLLNDIDLGKYSLLGLNKDYEIKGNNHTITISYEATTYTEGLYDDKEAEIISLFGCANNLIISDLTIDVSFKNRDVFSKYSIGYFAPLGYEMTNCKFNNLTINYSIKNKIENLVYCENENGVYSYDDNTKFVNVTINKN